MPLSAETSSSSIYKSQNQHNNMGAAERVEFSDAETRNEFFSLLKSYSNERTWDNLYKKFNIDRSLFQGYRYGQFTLPKDKFQTFLEFFPNQERERFISMISTKPGNWERRLGGKSTYSKYPEIFQQGREKAWHSPNHSGGGRRYYDLNIPLSQELCEFIGALIGDGFTNQYGSYYQTGFCGDKRFDKDYYDTLIIPIARDLFEAKAHFRYKNNGMWINFHSVFMHKVLTERFGIPKGMKFDKVLIPEEILNSNQEFIVATLRGVFDTDGSIYFDKRKIYRKPYARIELNMKNPALIAQVHSCLQELGVNSKVLSCKTRLQIIGFDAVKGYLKKVGFSNKRHLKRTEKFAQALLQYNKSSSI